MRVDGKSVPAVAIAAPVTETKKRGRPKKVTSPTNSQDQGEIKTIHHIIILDESGSMAGFKAVAARQGIEEQLLSIDKEKLVNNVVTLVVFGTKIEFLIYAGDAKATLKCNFGGANMGGTALNDAIFKAGEYAKSYAAKESPYATLISVFTDGEENSSHILTNYKAPAYFEDLQRIHKFTLTFIGTDYDVQRMIRSYNIDPTNTITHNNTAESIASVMNFTAQARSAYSKSVAEGVSLDLLNTSFYTKVVINE